VAEKSLRTTGVAVLPQIRTLCFFNMPMFEKQLLGQDVCSRQVIAQIGNRFGAFTTWYTYLSK